MTKLTRSKRCRTVWRLQIVVSIRELYCHLRHNHSQLGSMLWARFKDIWLIKEGEFGTEIRGHHIHTYTYIHLMHILSTGTPWLRVKKFPVSANTTFKKKNKSHLSCLSRNKFWAFIWVIVWMRSSIIQNKLFCGTGWHINLKGLGLCEHFQEITNKTPNANHNKCK